MARAVRVRGYTAKRGKKMVHVSAYWRGKGRKGPRRRSVSITKSRQARVDRILSKTKGAMLASQQRKRSPKFVPGKTYTLQTKWGTRTQRYVGKGKTTGHHHFAGKNGGAYVYRPGEIKVPGGRVRKK